MTQGFVRGKAPHLNKCRFWSGDSKPWHWKSGNAVAKSPPGKGECLAARSTTALSDHNRCWPHLELSPRVGCTHTLCSCSRITAGSAYGTNPRKRDNCTTKLGRNTNLPKWSPSSAWVSSLFLYLLLDKPKISHSLWTENCNTLNNKKPQLVYKNAVTPVLYTCACAWNRMAELVKKNTKMWILYHKSSLKNILSSRTGIPFSLSGFRLFRKEIILLS